MLVVLSPAKNLDTTITESPITPSQPELLADAKLLAKECKKLSPADLSSLMGISDKLAILNAERFNSFSTPFTEDNAKPAVLTFNGDVYGGLEASSLTASQLTFAQQHLRILSGLYGVLKPMDLIQPYRLEMGKALKNSRGDNLYQFWGAKIAQTLNKALQQHEQQVVINLASNEYFKAVEKKALKADVITPVFKDTKNGKLKVISFYAKKARGMMARYIIENQITDPEKLKQFAIAGYAFSAELSSQREWVFTRAEQNT